MAAEKGGKEVVDTREFDLTKFAKLLGVAVGLLAPAIAGALKAWKGAPTAVVVGALGVTAAALLAIALVSAVDIAARAFLSGEGSAQKKGGSDAADPASDEVVAAPKGMQVWLEGGGPYPVLAMSGSGESARYLVATGSTQERSVGDTKVKALDGSVEWCDADKVRAMRSDKWP